MPAGRPTKYSPELLESAWRYIDEYQTQGDAIPSQVGLCLWLDITRSTLGKWSNDDDKPEFSVILDKIASKQQVILLSKGLTGDFNAAIAKLALGKHGYHEKQDQQLSGPDGKPIEVDTRWEVEFINAPPQD